ncbi:hydroxymethylbilane synthase, partial [Candidatus Omnitrophota bacterium]
MENKTIILGTRGSRLALVQAENVKGMLQSAFPSLDVTLKIIKTEGDRDLTSPLTDFGGRGAFVRTIELALLHCEIDIAVHSLKDLPSQLPEGLCLGAAPERKDIRDVLISTSGKNLETLPPESIIATGSDRRKVQIGYARSDVTFAGIRGNIETRLRKLETEDIDAVIMAAAGLHRLGLESKITQYLEPEIVLPAPCQGALGIECRINDSTTREILTEIDNSDVRICVDAERTFIATLGMGCHT